MTSSWLDDGNKLQHEMGPSSYQNFEMVGHPLRDKGDYADWGFRPVQKMSALKNFTFFSWHSLILEFGNVLQLMIVGYESYVIK